MLVFNDRRWFSGSIFYYEFQCQDCGDRITFNRFSGIPERKVR